MRESWTDERLDDLNHRSEDGFKRVEADLRVQRIETRTEFASLRSETKAEFASLRSEMNAGFASLRSEMDERFDKVDVRFDAMQRLIVQVGGGMIATLIVGVLSVLAAQL